MEKPQSLSVDGTKYIREDLTPSSPIGNRAVVVVDRGWIFVGDLEEKNGRIYLSRVVWVFSWQGIGFDGVLKNPKSDKVTLKVMQHTVDIPKDAEVYRIPVESNWGL